MLTPPPLPRNYVILLSNAAHSIRDIRKGARAHLLLLLLLLAAAHIKKREHAKVTYILSPFLLPDMRTLERERERTTPNTNASTHRQKLTHNSYELITKMRRAKERGGFSVFFLLPHSSLLLSVHRRHSFVLSLSQLP